MPQKLGAFDVYGTLGKGEFSRVRFAVNRLTNSSYAIKIIDKIKLRSTNGLDNVKKEIAIIRTIDHKNCISIQDMFANPEKIFLVIDLMMGGSLMQRIAKKGHMSEDRSRYYFNQILEGVLYCHRMEIVIGGINLENILIDGSNVVKICDFKYSMLLSDYDMPISTGNRRLRQYLAPELLDNKTCVSYKSDVWALAVVLFTLVSGISPFVGGDDVSDEDILQCRHYPYPAWLSSSVLDFLNSMLVVDLSSRVYPTDLPTAGWMLAGPSEAGAGLSDHHDEDNEEEDDEDEDDDEDDDEEGGEGRGGGGGGGHCLYDDKVMCLPGPGGRRSGKHKVSSTRAAPHMGGFFCENTIPSLLQLLWMPFGAMSIPNPMAAAASTSASSAASKSTRSSMEASHRRSKRRARKRSKFGLDGRDPLVYDPSDFSASKDAGKEK